jgi:hypothetical protein
MGGKVLIRVEIQGFCRELRVSSSSELTSD